MKRDNVVLERHVPDDVHLDYMRIRFARLKSYYQRVPNGQLILCLRGYSELSGVAREKLRADFPDYCKRLDRLMLDY